MSRIMALDYGKKRTGVAVTDPCQIIANGLTTVDTPRLMQFLTDYFEKEQVERVVVGMPLQTTGEASENQQRVKEFVVRMNKMWPAMDVVAWDERYTSVMAHQTILEGGLHKMARRNKALVDEISATIILQSYMEAQRLRR